MRVLIFLILVHLPLLTVSPADTLSPQFVEYRIALLESSDRAELIKTTANLLELTPESARLIQTAVDDPVAARRELNAQFKLQDETTEHEHALMSFLLLCLENKTIPYASPVEERSLMSPWDLAAASKLYDAATRPINSAPSEAIASIIDQYRRSSQGETVKSLVDVSDLEVVFDKFDWFRKNFATREAEQVAVEKVMLHYHLTGDPEAIKVFANNPALAPFAFELILFTQDRGRISIQFHNALWSTDVLEARRNLYFDSLLPFIDKMQTEPLVRRKLADLYSKSSPLFQARIETITSMLKPETIANDPELQQAIEKWISDNQQKVQRVSESLAAKVESKKMTSAP